MKYVINNSYGGFGLSEPALNALILNAEYTQGQDIRTNKTLIRWLEEGKSAEVSGTWSKLMLVDIPDEATDWELIEYDGAEHIIAVIDGRIVHIYAKEDD